MAGETKLLLLHLVPPTATVWFQSDAHSAFQSSPSRVHVCYLPFCHVVALSGEYTTSLRSYHKDLPCHTYTTSLIWMLAGSITPRPRPPARSRRASSQVKSSPPPPYRPSLPDDPPSSNEHRKLSDESLRGDWAHFPFSTQSEQWNDQSREELSDLLHKADEIIKDRELGEYTSFRCRCREPSNL